MMRYVLTCIGLLAVLFGVVNALGNVMWNLADSMPLWWESEEDEDDRD